MATKEEKMEAFGQLLDILDELRVKCPWDRKQTNESLRTNTIEETYELCDAIMKNDNYNRKNWVTCSFISFSMQRSVKRKKLSISKMYATASARN